MLMVRSDCDSFTTTGKNNDSHHWEPLECHHPIFDQRVCTECGKYMDHHDEESSVALEYLLHGLRVSFQELDRWFHSECKLLLADKKLCLVLDLDQTLLHSIWRDRLPSNQQHLWTQIQDNPTGTLVTDPDRATKLRPYVPTFLEQASTMYDMWIYTMGSRSYALQMADLLDPQHKYFKYKVISREDCTQPRKKGLDVVTAPENMVVILDDTQCVWSNHTDNLILMEKYRYFDSESVDDEIESDGPLARALDKLKRVHCLFFSPHPDKISDVRDVLKMIQLHDDKVSRIKDKERVDPVFFQNTS